MAFAYGEHCNHESSKKGLPNGKPLIVIDGDVVA